MSQEKINDLLTVIFTTVLGGGAAASTLDNVEQWGRIILLGISIISGALLIIVNWKRAKNQIKEWNK